MDQIIVEVYKMKRILMTGGGTAGHVTPNLALVPSLRELGYDIVYIGSYTGIEKSLIEEEGIPYYGISSGKLRRYFDLKNFSDPFKVMKGYFQAASLLRKLKPDIVFSKGGFVSVPVVLAAGRKKIPTIIHESDMTPGLANKLAIPSATKVCCTFPETQKYLPEGKSVLSGSPIRHELLEGEKEKGLAICGFNEEKPVLMIIGGSTGARVINENVRNSLDQLLPHYQILHLCGKGMLDESLLEKEGYVQFEYVKEELKHLFAAADLVISRAGANSICELLTLQMPNILIPLSAAASRGDQILNAASFEKSGYSYILKEEDLTPQSLIDAVSYVSSHIEEYKKALAQSPTPDAIHTIISLIEETVSASKA